MTTMQSPAEDGARSLQTLLERMHDGDRVAREQLMERLYRRLVLLAGTLQRTYPDLADGHDPRSVLHDSWRHFAAAVDKARPPTIPDFFRLAARKFRQTLLSMARRQRDRRARLGGTIGGLTSTSSGAFPSGPVDTTHDPGRLALLTEAHRKVKGLPPELRSVFEMHYYLGITQAEISSLVGLSPREVSRRWVAATEKLADQLDGLEDLL